MVSDQTVSEQQVEASSESQELKQVSFDEYKKTRDDMHKFKKRFKQSQEQIEKLTLALQEREQQEMETKQEFKSLYEKERASKATIEAQLKDQLKSLQEGLKLTALRAELPLKKQEYERFLQLDAIEIGEDGAPTKESLSNVVESFKQNYPDLLKEMNSQKKTSQIPHVAQLAKETSSSGTLSQQDKKTLLAEHIKRLKFNK